MRILLVQPPFDHNETVMVENLGIGYLTSALRKSGHEVEVLDSHLQSLTVKDAVKEILIRDFECLGLSSGYAQAQSAFSIARMVRKKRKNALIIMGGYLPTLNTDYVLRTCPEIDFTVIGEGDLALPDAIGRIDRGESWQDAPGVSYMSNDSVIANPPPPLVTDLDSLPFPARDAIKAAKSTSANIAGGRGCHHRCSFCCIQSFYSKHGPHHPRFRTPVNIVDELQSVIEETGIHKFGFVDDDFIGVGPKFRARAIAIAEEIKARKLDIDFSLECRVDGVDVEVLQTLKEAGLTRVLLGVESGVQRQLDLYNKRVTVEQNKRAIEIVRGLGIGLMAGFIMMDPYVTPEEITENLEFLRETQIMGGDGIAAENMMKLKLFRGLPLVDKLREDGLLIEKGLDLDYKFKDPRTAIMYKALKGMSLCKKLTTNAKGLVGIREKVQ